VQKEKVMNEEEIAEKIRYILEPIGQLPRPAFYRTKDTRVTTERVQEFSNEHVELLLQLFVRIDTETGKDFFWQLLGYNFVWPITLNSKNMLPSMPKRKAFLLCRQHCDITAMVYVKSGRTDEVLNGLLERAKDYTSINEPNIKVISCLCAVALNEPSLLSDNYLKKIEIVLGRFQEYVDKVNLLSKENLKQEQLLSSFLPGIQVGHTAPPLPSYDLIAKLYNLVVRLRNALATIRFDRVKQELRGVSSEINQDKKRLIYKYSELGLSKSLIEALEKIDIEIEETGSKFNFSKSIGFVRNIYEESLREFAIKIQHATGIVIPQWTNDRGKMGEAISYFRHVKFLSDKEEKLLTGFSSVISDAGSHSLTSEKYEVRISKNILVEICSYLVDKIDNFLKSQVKNKP
jgi:hypothetical protein